MSNNSIKQLLHHKCIEYVEQRISIAKMAIDSALESGNDETKSSAGDKHETGRAMAQLEQEKSVIQLKNAIAIQQQLLKINPDLKSLIVSTGSLVLTDKGNFYISIAAGKLEVDKKIYFAISPISPIAMAFMGSKEKQKVVFNGLTYCINNIL